MIFSIFDIFFEVMDCNIKNLESKIIFHSIMALLFFTYSSFYLFVLFWIRYYLVSGFWLTIY